MTKERVIVVVKRAVWGPPALALFIRYRKNGSRRIPYLAAMSACEIVVLIAFLSGLPFAMMGNERVVGYAICTLLVVWFVWSVIARFDERIRLDEIRRTRAAQSQVTTTVEGADQ